MQLSIRQSPLQHLSIVPRSAFCQNDSRLDISLANCIHSLSPESAADWLQKHQRPQIEMENRDPLVRLLLSWASWQEQL